MILTVHQYRDRIEAGQILARQLAHYASRADTLVLALSPGGVPVAIEVAKYLHAPLDLFTVCKLGSAEHPGVTLGAVAPGGVRVLDDEAIAQARLTGRQLAEITGHGRAELDRRQRMFRGARPDPVLIGRVIILIDEGVATGFSMHAGVVAVHRQQPAWIVAAAPVGSIEACNELAHEVHEVVCPLRPDPLQAIGLWYEHFSPAGDEEVVAALRRAAGLPA